MLCVPRWSVPRAMVQGFGKASWGGLAHSSAPLSWSRRSAFSVRFYSEKAAPLEPNRIGLLVDNKWQVMSKQASGGFGDIFEGKDIVSDCPVIIKIEKKTKSTNSLSREAEIYKYLLKRSNKEKRFFIPDMLWFGTNVTDDKLTILVLEKLGPSMHNLYKEYHKFSLKTVLLLAIQMLDCIEFLHRNHILHRDIKPGNFVLGAGEHSRLVYLIDFGLSSFYIDKKTKAHIALSKNTAFRGTTRYASTNSLKKIEQSRRDDLESLGYVLIYLLKGKLPWSHIKVNNDPVKRQKVTELKSSTVVFNSLFEDIPDAFKQYMLYTKSLKFADKPNYEYLKELFFNCFKQEGFKLDFIYDWDEIKKL